jgi:peptidoglycan hydrolase-like protein with peptidoglycan-binding domain
VSLQSKLFKSDQKLQACLVKDAAHVTEGAVGEHVGRIQTALNALGDVEIDAAEIAARRYGRSTAAAVLAYKKKRNIINFSYQTQADNIVGKMTIASLDKEMARVETSVVATHSRCRWSEKGA